MTPQEIGAVLIALSLCAYFTGKFRTISAVAVFAGIILTGLTGWIVTHTAMLLGWVSSWAGPWIASATGWTAATVGAVFFAVVAYFVIHDWAPRNSAKKRTYWLSALLALIIVAGAAPIVALNQLPSSAQTGVTTVQGG